MTAPLRAGLIGLGRIGRHHARILQALPGVVLAGAADPLGDRYSAAGAAPVVGGVEELLGLGVDYAVLACPTAQHEALGLKLAAAGTPALIEKPLAASPDAAWRLATVFASAGLPAAVGYVERFNPALAALAGRLADGALGDVFSVSTRRIGPFPPRVTDIGVIYDLATHDVDLTSWITGSRYTSVAARAAFRSGRLREDLLAAVGQLANGTIAHHEVNWISPLKARTTAVTGERGCLVADSVANTLTFHANAALQSADLLGGFCGVSEGDVTRYALPEHEPLFAEHAAFRDLVRGGVQRCASLEEGLRAVLVADAAAQSARTGDLITVPASVGPGQGAAALPLSPFAGRVIVPSMG